MSTTRTIRRSFKVDGVLTDVTAAVLADPTGGYGVKRTDTDAVVVAADTSMTHDATGVYTYSFTAVDGVAYAAYTKFTYGGADYYQDHDFAAYTPDDDLAMTVSYPQLVEIVGRTFFGKRTGLSADEMEDIDDIIKAGLQMVYRAHHWSFFRPTKDIVTVADDYDYDLPTGFDGIEDNLLTWPEGEGYYRPVPVVPWSDIRRRRTEDETTGRPEYAAIISVEFDATLGSRRQIVFFPTPDDAYTLSCVMRLRWTMIDVSNPYPIGGEILAEAIREACLAAGERILDNAAGIHTDAFREALEAAIRLDKEATSPTTLGQDGGPLDLSGRSLSRAYDMGDVTFNGETM
ncbi:MAG: hypothetical protein LC130_12440 [Bryobacterales bacterium]|nr:hypothetical protein [Bryobacterales bacterium]